MATFSNSFFISFYSVQTLLSGKGLPRSKEIELSQIRTKEEMLFGKQANFLPKPSPYISVPTCPVACCAYLPN